MASIGLKINDGSSTGIDSGVADVFAKALFGDPEAAAKIALTKAQIANYGANVTKLGTAADLERQQALTQVTERQKFAAEAEAQKANAAKTGVETQRQVAAQNARNDWGTSLGDELANAVNKPPTVEKDRPLPDFQGPMPMVVPPEAAAKYANDVAAARARAKVIALGTTGDDPTKLTEAERTGIGISRYANPDPSTIRTDYTLLTGKEPTTAPLMQGDNAGTQQLIDVEKAKIEATPKAPIIKPDPVTGQDMVFIPDVSQPSGYRAIPVAGEKSKEDPNSNINAQARVDAVEKLLRDNAGASFTPEQATQYENDIYTLHPARTTSEINDKGQKVEKDTYGIIPDHTPRPEDIWARAGGKPQAPQTPQAQPAPGMPAVIQRGGPGLANVPTVPVQPNASGAMPVPVQVPGGSSLFAPGPGGEGSLTPLVPPAAAQAAQAVQAAAVPAAASRERIVQAKPPPLPTEFGSRAMANAGRMGEAAAFFNSVKPENVPNLLDTIKNLPNDNLPLGVWAQSIADPASRTYFVKAMAVMFPGLRFDSGAAISKEEIATALSTEIPMPGDDQRTIDAKHSTMAAHLRGILASGYGYGTDQYNQQAADFKAHGFDINYHDTSRATDYVNPDYVPSESDMDSVTGAIKKPGAPAVAAPTVAAPAAAAPAAAAPAVATPAAPAAAVPTAAVPAAAPAAAVPAARPAEAAASASNVVPGVNPKNAAPIQRHTPAEDAALLKKYGRKAP